MVAAYLPLTNSLGQAWTYLILFVGPLVIAWLIFYTMLPETKGKQLNEIIWELETLPSLKGCYK
jgi:H+/Cl- antiporter ClcA